MISYLKFFVNNFETIYHLYRILSIYTNIIYDPISFLFNHLLIGRKNFDKPFQIRYFTHLYLTMPRPSSCQPN